MYRDSNGILRGSRDERPVVEMTRDELLWLFRTSDEGNHRYTIHHRAIMYTYKPSVRDAAANCLPTIPELHWLNTCNKSVPVYITPGSKWLLLRMVLHNYIYRRWFRPYRSEIDHGRFICNFIYPHDLPFTPTLSLSDIHDIVSLNQAICTKLETQRGVDVDHIGDYIWMTPKTFRDNYILQPLFRALLIIVHDEKYNKETSQMVGNLPVYLIRTGVEEGLSAPISFELIAAKINSHLESGRVIEVTLETAIDFVMELEAREATAFGLRPDPVADWKPSNDMIEAWQLIGETEPLVGPTSQWVNDEKYPQWSGAGQQSDSEIMTKFEEVEFRARARREGYLEEQRSAAEPAAE